MNTLNRFLALALLALAVGLAAAAGAQTLHNGQFIKKNYRIDGGWSIVHTDQGRYLELDARFRTKNAPDLKLFLSRLPGAELSNGNTVANSVLISPLKSNKGAQRYLLPENIDLDEYQSLVIHCEAFSKLWGVSDLHRPAAD